MRTVSSKRGFTLALSPDQVRSLRLGEKPNAETPSAQRDAEEPRDRKVEKKNRGTLKGRKRARNARGNRRARR